MMRSLHAAIFAGAMIATGCCSVGHERVPRWGDIENLRLFCDNYEHVILVCVYEDYWERLPDFPPSVQHFKATVIRAYKGGMTCSERIAFGHGSDDDSPDVSVNRYAGELMYVFTNGTTQAEVGVGTGDFERYSREVEVALRVLFPGATKGR
jgi:hypothetical protein